MSQFWSILIYGLIAGGATIIGAYLVFIRESWARKNSIHLISFSAGVLLSVGLGQLLPEAQTLSNNAIVFLLISFVLFYILEHGLIMHACLEDDDCEVHPIDRIALFGLGFHSLLDGIVIGVGFEISPALGIIATLSVLIHKLPDGISMSSILLHSQYSRKKTINSSLLVALATPIGAVGSYFLFQGISENILGILLALAAGSFLYVSATDLIPEIHKKSQVTNIVLVILGIIFPYLIGWLLG